MDSLAACLSTPIVALGLALLGALPAAGCAVSSAPPGRLTLRWSIAGGFDPGECDAKRATTLDVLVYDDSGGFQGEYVADCATFGTTIDLPPARYTAQVS